MISKGSLSADYGFAMNQSPITSSDLRGLSLLVADGVVETSRIVEHLHHSIASLALPLGRAPRGSLSGISGLVYRSVRQIATLSGKGAGWALGRFTPPVHSGKIDRDAWVSVLNGVMGDYLEARANPLAIGMQLFLGDQPLDCQQGLTGVQAPLARRRLLVSVHGLCLNESCWFRKGGEQNLPMGLEESRGYTPVFVRYNSGRHISDNGAQLAEALDCLRAIWPVPLDEIVLLGHSMGGLVACSACHHAELHGLAWLNEARAVITLGSPHQGAPLERIGAHVHQFLGFSPYSAPFSRLGRLRSAGITDLRFGNVRPEDWQGQDRFRPEPDARQSVRLADHIKPFAVAATLDSSARSLRSRTLGDGLVPVSSALGENRRPELCWPVPTHQKQVFRRLGHIDLIYQARVLYRLRQWLD